MNHWAATDREIKQFLASRLGTDLPRDVTRPVPRWQRHALRRIARAFRIPSRLLRPHLPTPPYKRNARRYGR